MEKRLELQVDAGDLGERVDRFVAGRVRSLSRTFVAALVGEGRVLVDGVPVARAAQRLQRPGRVSVLIAARENEPEVDLSGRIVFLDDALVAVDKPSGLPVSARLRLAGEDAIAATRRALVARGLDASFLGNPHRLDKDTSGVLLLARTREAARALARSFARRETRKHYLAWVDGLPARHSGAITAPIHAPGDGEARIDPALGRPARTRFRVVRVTGGTSNSSRGRSLVVLALLTGRTHQLRLHLAHEGTPIVGDRLYGVSSGDRLLLHARKLTLRHPTDNRRIVLKAPPPFPLR